LRHIAGNGPEFLIRIVGRSGGERDLAADTKRNW
jgi:hypothetical protein